MPSHSFTPSPSLLATTRPSTHSPSSSTLTHLGHILSASSGSTSALFAAMSALTAGRPTGAFSASTSVTVAASPSVTAFGMLGSCREAAWQSRELPSSASTASPTYLENKTEQNKMRNERKFVRYGFGFRATRHRMNPRWLERPWMVHQPLKPHIIPCVPLHCALLSADDAEGRLSALSFHLQMTFTHARE